MTLSQPTKIKLSYSSLSTFEKCPRKWYHRYILKQYIDEKSQEAIFGNFIHDICENYNGGGFDELMELYKNKIDKYKFDDKLFSNKLENAFYIFDSYYNYHIKNCKKVYKEKELNIPINERYSFTGKIDLFSYYNGEWIITDYKTCKNKDDHEAQLSIYFYLLKKLQNPYNKSHIKCHILYLSLDNSTNKLKDCIEHYKIGNEEFERIECKINSIMKRIDNLILKDNKEMWKMKEGPLCNYCEYFKKNMCLPDNINIKNNF